MAKLDVDEERLREATKKAALSGGLSGGVLGGATAMMSGVRSPGRLLAAALGGGAATGGLTGGSIYAGSKAMGVPEADEPSGYALRGGLGGLMAGGMGGALLGALASRARPLKTLTKMAEKAEVPVDNLMGDFYKRLTNRPMKEAMAKGSMLGGGIGAGVGAFLGSDEGMQLDFIENQLKEARRQRLREELIP